MSVERIDLVEKVPIGTKLFSGTILLISSKKTQFDDMINQTSSCLFRNRRSDDAKLCSISFTNPDKVLLIISAIEAAPASANKCEECPLDYKPVCAGPSGSTDDKLKKSFGSACVLRKYNCEKNERKLFFNVASCVTYSRL